VEPFQLHSEVRAEQRAEWEFHRREREAEIKLHKRKREDELAEKEDQAVAEARAATVHIANPIRRYKAVPSRQIRPLTEPESPHFSDRLSKYMH